MLNSRVSKECKVIDSRHHEAVIVTVSCAVSVEWSEYVYLFKTKAYTICLAWLLAPSSPYPSGDVVTLSSSKALGSISSSSSRYRDLFSP